MKILIIGFQRSGTTLLKDLVGKHPGVRHMFHEVALMRFQKNRLMNSKRLPDKSIRNNYQGVIKCSYEINFNMEKCNWGEKIPYWDSSIHKGFRGAVSRYCNTWINYFGKEARILHIVRHPLDVAISTKKRGFTKDIEYPLRKYKIVVPIVIDSFVNHVKPHYIKHIQFENLVSDPMIYLKEVYKFCNLRHKEKVVQKVVNDKNIFRFRKVDSSRAFAYKQENMKLKKFKLQSILNKLNTLNGIHYNVKG